MRSRLNFLCVCLQLSRGPAPGDLAHPGSAPGVSRAPEPRAGAVGGRPLP